MALSVAVEERVEYERPFVALGCRRRSVGAVARIEDAGLGGALRFRIGGRPLRRCVRGIRRQVEAALAAAAAERERGHAQQDDGPSRRCQPGVTGHDEIPNTRAAPYKDCSALARATAPWKPKKLQRNFCDQPNFRSFSSRFSQALACAVTFFGAVPP